MQALKSGYDKCKQKGEVQGYIHWGGGYLGLVYAETDVSNITDNTKSFSGSFLVDTGATDTVIPSDELEKIGIGRVGKRDYELADGTIVSYDIGHAFVRVNGEKTVANVVFGETGTEPLLGVIVLQSAGFMVDPVNHVLKKIPVFSMK